MARIGKGDYRQLLTSEFMVLDVSAAHDPDTDPDLPDNDLVVEMFCFPRVLLEQPILSRQVSLHREVGTLVIIGGGGGLADCFIQFLTCETDLSSDCVIL